jgi:hypothetical protein
MFEDLFHLPLVSTTPVVHLMLRISPRIFDWVNAKKRGCEVNTGTVYDAKEKQGAVDSQWLQFGSESRFILS